MQKFRPKQMTNVIGRVVSYKYNPANALNRKRVN